MIGNLADHALSPAALMAAKYVLKFGVITIIKSKKKTEEFLKRYAELVTKSTQEQEQVRIISKMS